MTHTWILPTFGAFVCWGIANFLPKVFAKQISPMSAIVYEAVGGLIVVLCVLIYLGFKVEFSLRGGSWAILAGALGTLGALFLFFALKDGKVSIVIPLVTLYPIIAVLLAFLFLKEPVSARQLAGMGCAFIAITLLAS